MDTKHVLDSVRRHLHDHGMRPRGADLTDYQWPADRRLYFRTGSAYKEVSVIAYFDEVKQPPLRIVNEEQLVEVKYAIDAIISAYRRNLDLERAGADTDGNGGR